MNISEYAGSSRGGVDSEFSMGPSDVWISHNRLRAAYSSDTDSGNGIHGNQPNGGMRIFNNVVYDFDVTNDNRGILSGDGAISVYNNTVVRCQRGIVSSSAATNLFVINNIVQDSVEIDFQYMYMASLTSHNISTDASSPDGLGSQIVEFLDYYGDDFHLAADDIAAQHNGTDLSMDPRHPFADDLDGQPRSAPWDIGADQYDD